MGRGGKTSATWPKGKKPPVKKPKGRKNNRTLVKEAIGLQNWEGLKTFLQTEGSTKMIAEIQKLKGKDYINATTALLEYVKPKLTRVDGKIKTDVDLTNAKITFS